MASAMFVTYEEHNNQRTLGRYNAMKRNQVSQKSFSFELPSSNYSIEFPSNFVGPETVGECFAQNFAVSETASEDSCSIKRKSVSTNFDGPWDAVNSAATSLNYLSRNEKKRLRKRLRVELEQVHRLILRLEARELGLKGFLQVANNGSASKSGGEPLPLSGETSQSEDRILFKRLKQDLQPEALFKEKRTPKANHFYPNADFVLGKDRMPFFEKHKSKPGFVKRSLPLKRNVSDMSQQNVDIINARKIAELMRQCGTILKKLMSHKHGWIFNEPVDVVKLGLHDYLEIIEKPMDLGTIKSKLYSNKYESPLEFAEDVRLTFVNAMKYNPKGHDVHIMADVLRMMFEDRWKALAGKLKLVNLDADTIKREIQLPVETAARDTSTLVSTRRSCAVVAADYHDQLKPMSRKVKRQMTYEEKQTLRKLMEDLPLDKVQQVLPILKRNPNLTHKDGEVEVDIDSFDSETLWELHSLVTCCKKANKHVQQQSGGGEIVQPLNGAFHSSKSDLRGTDVGEEEVDIGVDVPSTSFPPVDIDKDGAAGSKCSSSSSSSSDSESSSSDSDSGSSSGDESDGDDQSPRAGSKVFLRKDF